MSRARIEVPQLENMVGVYVNLKVVQIFNKIN